MLQRIAKNLIDRLKVGYPVVAVTGPRQSGKTTLVRSVFSDKDYVTLEDPDTRAFALEDPRGFLERYRQGVILDEVQNIPTLMSYIQGIVDTDKKMGQFILTGSQQFNFRSQISQSLAGRVGYVELLPFSLPEFLQNNVELNSLESYLIKGFYPPLYDRNIKYSDWIADYITTYIERDLRQLLLVKNLRQFRTFLGLVAGRVGQPVNLTSLGNDAGVSSHTVKEWLSILEASYIIKLVSPYYKNFSKRLIKSPKIYFLDTGLLCSLLGIKTEHDIQIHPFKGGIFESFIFAEIQKHIFNNKLQSEIFFWRTHKGFEVDFLIESSVAELIAVECKAGKTIAQSFFKELNRFKDNVKNLTVNSYLIYGGREAQERTGNTVIPWLGVTKIFN